MYVLILELKVYCGPDKFYGRSNFGQYDKEKNRDPYFVWLRIAEGSVPETHIWSILLIKSGFKWCINLSRSLFFIFQLIGDCHCWWTSESTRVHVAKSYMYGRLRLIRSVSESSKFTMLKLIEIEIV